MQQTIYCDSLEDELHQFMHFFMRLSYKKGLVILPHTQYIWATKKYFSDRGLPSYLLPNVNTQLIGVYLYVYDGEIPNLGQDIVSIVHSSYFSSIETLKHQLVQSDKDFIVYDVIQMKQEKELPLIKSNVKRQSEYDFSDKNSKHLINREIHDKFIETFDIAEYEIDIISPWISNNVVDDILIMKMEQALMRGVKIKIKYGIGHVEDNRNQKSDEVANLLKAKFRNYKTQFIIQKENIHYKLLLCDNKYMVSGSYNFLSFKGTYIGEDDRHEGAEYIVDSKKVKELRKKYFN